MKLPWQKKETAPVHEVRMRAAVVPKAYKFQLAFGVTANNFTVNSISTHIVTLQPLKDGETAESVSKFAAGTMNFGGSMFTEEEVREKNLQRLQFDAPNWVGILVCSDESVYSRHIDIPVWGDPETGKIYRVDLEAMLAELEPKRQRASEIWGLVDGPFSDYFAIRDLPKTLIKTGKDLASLPRFWAGAVKDMVDDMNGKGKPPEPIPPHAMPDLSQYPPIEGIDYETWALFSAVPAKIMESGVALETWLAADKGWQARVMKDWKLGALYGNDVERIRKVGGG
jgi:hypothetical protein